MPDNVGKMFYYGETPWHKKGTRLTQPATAEEAINAGGLDWGCKTRADSDGRGAAEENHPPHGSGAR
jgi:hypothetical protein